MIVSSGYLITPLVSELQLDVFVLKAVLVQYRGRQSSKAVAGHAAFIAQTIQRKQDCIVAHWLLLVVRSGENQPSIPCEQTESTHHCDRLSRQGDNMGRIHLHALGWNIPARTVQIKLRPLCLDEF